MTMVNAKMGVNAFGTTAPKAESTITAAQNVSATDKAKLNNEDVGNLANKLADPNWVDPSKKVRAVGNPNLDKDAFFKMMMAQMKNQDPTNPLKSHEMAAQLANFSSLEQMQNMNRSLDEIKGSQKPTENFQALNLIGKAVTGDSAQIVRGPTDKTHDFKFQLPLDASEVNIKVKDATGALVRNFDLRALKKGDNKFTWNGQNEQGATQPVGEYRFFAEAKTADGKKIAIKTDFEGLISGVSYSGEGPVLHVGQQSIKFRDVRKITDPRLMKNDQKVNNITSQDLKTTNAIEQTKGVPTDESAKNPPAEEAKAASTAAPKAVSNIMDAVGLSHQMMEKIAKETAG